MFVLDCFASESVVEVSRLCQEEEERRAEALAKEEEAQKEEEERKSLQM